MAMAGRPGGAPAPRLKEKYESKVRPKLMQQFGFTNPHQVPTLEKIAINIGVGSLLGNWDLDWLASTDMDRALSLTREFQSREAMAVMQLNVCRGALRRLSATAR